MATKGTVGVIGLGIMGGAFAHHLAAAGWHVIGYDLDPKRRRALAKAGVEVVSDAAAVAAAAPVIITSLPNPRALHDTVKAIVAANEPERVVIEASTFTLDDKLKAERALAKGGHVMLDCPVSGTGSQARTKDIIIYASGEPKAIRRVRPLLADISRATHDLGTFGHGSRRPSASNRLFPLTNVARWL